MKFQNLSRESVQQSQLALLRKQISYCEKNVPYYRDLLKRLSLNGDGIKDLSQLERLPLLAKATVRENEASFRSETLADSKCHKSFSSGSTGEPFASYFDTRAWLSKKYWVKLRSRFACGMSLRQSVAIIECEPEDQVSRRNAKTRLADLLLKVRVFSLFKDKHELILDLKSFAPQNIYAYPSHLLELADAHPGKDSVIPGLQRLFTSSEFLERGMRELIERKFGAPVYDTYGSTEFKEVAWQCTERDWYHINNDQVICEVVDKHGTALINEPGHIVVSDLQNKAMPLLRFDLGDLGILTDQPCKCGYQGSSIKPLGGRSSDYLELESGVQLSPFRFTTEIEYLPGILQYQVEQLSLSQIRVHTRWDGQPSEESLTQVESIIRSALAEAASEREVAQIAINVTVCDAISTEQNGKFKVVKRAF